MKARGLVGTFFVNPDVVDDPYTDAATTAQLNDLHAAGWSIQAYSGVNMADLLSSGGAVAARARLAEVKRGMAARGFVVSALAPTQVAWNDELKSLAGDYFQTVRAIQGSSRQDYPFPDPLWVKEGGQDSLSSHDTAQSLSASLDHWEAVGGIWTLVIHKVGDDADPSYSVGAADFASLCDKIAAEVKAGRVKMVTYGT